MVGWDELLVSLKERVEVRAVDEVNLRSVLDSSKSGYVSIYNFANYVKCFGPFSAAIGNVWSFFLVLQWLLLRHRGIWC